MNKKLMFAMFAAAGLGIAGTAVAQSTRRRRPLLR